ncbi:MAG: 16S rRNA (guanine(966)-N(2))-methyltransferase RsmD [bacterium]
MRIISGLYKGRKIPNVFNVKEVNPSSDIVKGALFNILAGEIQGKIFFDVYAGTGNIGFEALSRGAEFCVFIEKLNQMTSYISKIANEFNIKDKTKIICGDANKFINKDLFNSYKPNFIFIDPPYDYNLAEKSLENIIDSYYLSNLGNGLDNDNDNADRDNNLTIIVQHNKKEILKDNYEEFYLTKKSIYGKSALSFYEKGRQFLE